MTFISTKHYNTNSTYIITINELPLSSLSLYTGWGLMLLFVITSNCVAVCAEAAFHWYWGFWNTFFLKQFVQISIVPNAPKVYGRPKCNNQYSFFYLTCSQGLKSEDEDLLVGPPWSSITRSFIEDNNTVSSYLAIVPVTYCVAWHRLWCNVLDGRATVLRPSVVVVCLYGMYCG